ncbi:Six-hairpin glycosidase-like protein [Vararia minispora EC-137]|uniref:Six-hairpin glycosidase-like protein n=1 Tax=Vararia minispora EC-137 TaxID=1314806 RepID=A0ACB8QWN4_9AGAM|nr:Six-hairpin glycosidase-like protein [Vararia minispora EC-137]
MRFTSGLEAWSLVAAGSLFTVSIAAQGCPDFAAYASSPQGNVSAGSLALPYMRPSPECRTFNSTAVEKVINDVTSRMKDPDLARLFENTFPNTLDTTIKYFDPAQNLAFIITGVRDASQWLRDTANQIAVYQALIGQDKDLKALVKAIINNEARYISEYPYCGSFQPPPESGLAPTHNDYADLVIVNPPVNNQTVFECKYEIDSLCGFLKLSRGYYQATNDSSFMNGNWSEAISQIFRVIKEQSQPTFDEDFNVISYYNWSGIAGSLSPPVNNEGNGEPKGYTGMVGTHHRPSDDLSTYGAYCSAFDDCTAFLTPANAMLSVELGHLADIVDDVGLFPNVSSFAREWSERIKAAIWNTTVVNNVFAYETNGLGSRYVMDDANVPSLISLPYLGFLNKADSAYVATRQLLLSRQNPYFAAGANFSGIGGPHVDVQHPWPMSRIAAIFGTDDDDEILDSLYLIANNTNGLGLIHESVNIHNQSDYTRPWFAWANSFFAEMILDLAQRKPGLIFTANETYVPGM